MEQEQMNTPNSTNTVDMNFLKKFVYLLISSYRNKPFKLWTNVILFVLSIGILIVIRTNNGFIPSLLDNETNQLINIFLDFISISYIIGLISYLYWEVSSMKKELTLSSGLIFIILISITVALFLIPVYDGLRNIILPDIKLTLGEFGSFFASITGLLAFLAVLYTSGNADKRAKETIELAKEEAENNRVRAEKAEENNRLQIEDARNRYREDSERTIFFQLLDLHIKKAESVTYTKGNSEITGIKAFKEYAEKANNYLVLYLVTNHIENNPENKIFSKNKQYNDAYMKVKYIYEVSDYKSLKSKIKKTKICGDIIGEKDIEKDTTYIDNPARLEVWVWAEDIARQLIKKEKYKEINDILNEVYNVLYKEYGHILGHYFRNMYYVMDTIDKFNGNEEYKKNYSHIFRAQLSRYEIAMAVYNAVNYTRSTKNVVKLLKKYDMLNGFYYKDLFLTTIDLETEVVNQKKGVDLVLKLLDSYLESQDTTQN